MIERLSLLSFIFSTRQSSGTPVLDSFERILRLLFLVDVNLGEPLTDVRECSEVGREGNTRQFAFQVGGITLAVERMVQHGVDVMKSPHH